MQRTSSKIGDQGDVRLRVNVYFSDVLTTAPILGPMDKAVAAVGGTVPQM
jgi:hypothetical protein